jgi:hypothetical protein
MFDPKLNHEPNKLEETLDELFDSLSFRSGDTDEYAKIVDQIQKLYPLKDHDSKRKISPDTLAMIAANLAGIALIVGHERMNVVTSKAIGFVLKLR